MLWPALLIMTSFQQLLTFHFIELSVYLCEKCNRIQSSVTHQSIHVAFGNNQHNKVREKKSPITIFQNTVTFSYSNSSTYDKCSYNDSRAPFLSQIHLPQVLWASAIAEYIWFDKQEQQLPSRMAVSVNRQSNIQLRVKELFRNPDQ